MSKKIRIIGPAPKVIRNTSVPPARVEPALVAAALGGKASDQRLEDVLAPISLFAVRAELMGRLQSSGVRPALKGTSHGAKIPLGDAEWAELEELAAAISVPGLTPTAGQIASVLLTLSVKSVISQIARVQNSASSSLAHDLATRSVGEPAKHQTLPDM